MFGNAINQTKSPGGIRRGLIWQSDGGSKYKYFRVITKDMFKSYRGSSEYLQLLRRNDDTITSFDSEYNAIKVDIPFGSSYLTTYYKPMRVLNNGFYQDVWAFWAPSSQYPSPVWYTGALLSFISGVSTQPKIEPFYSDDILTSDLPGYQPSSVTDSYPLSVHLNGNLDAYLDKWIVQNQFFGEKGKEYTIAPPSKCYYDFNPPYNYSFPSSAYYDSTEGKYAVVPDQNPIDVVVAKGLDFDTTNLLQPLPNTHRLSFTNTFIINKAFTNLIKVEI